MVESRIPLRAGCTGARTVSWRAVFLSLSMLLLPASTLTGCASTAAVPATFCGLKVDTSLYGPLFPSGKTLKPTPPGFRAVSQEQMLGIRGCSYQDSHRNTLISASQEGVGQDSISKVVKSSNAANLRDFQPVNGPYEAASWKDDLGAYVAAIVPCSIPVLDTNWYMLTIQAGSSATDVKTLRKLITPAAKAYLAVTPCQPAKPATSPSPAASSPSPAGGKSN